MTRKVTTTGDVFAKGHRRGQVATLRLTEAYRAVFTMAKPMQEDIDLVLADLAEFSGYYACADTTASDAELRELNGSRKVFARILSLVDVPVLQMNALRQAALDEMQISNEEGLR